MSYTFPNAADYIRVGSPVGTPLTVPQSAGSLMIWAKPNTDLSGTTAALFDTRDVTPTRLFGITLSGGSTYAGWVPVVGTNDYRVVSAAGFPASGVWTCFVVTWDDTANETKLYIGGTQRGSTVTSLTTYDTASDDEYIGDDATAGDPANSHLAYLTIWNRVLSGTEITNLLTQTPAVAAASGRVHEWDMLVDADDSVGSNNGTVSGASLVSGEGPYGGSAVLTGTAVGGITEADVVTGGKVITVTLTGDTWIPN